MTSMNIIVMTGSGGTTPTTRRRTIGGLFWRPLLECGSGMRAMQRRGNLWTQLLQSKALEYCGLPDGRDRVLAWFPADGTVLLIRHPMNDRDQEDT